MDIAKRLRETHSENYGLLHEEAADEIEQLRGLSDSWAKIEKENHEEIKRLRAALKEAADAYNNEDEDACVIACGNIAASVLVGQTG